MLVAAALVPTGMGEYRNFVLCLIGVYALGAVGLTVLIGHGGMISLGHAGFAAVGAYTAALLMIRADVSFWIALPASGVVGGIAGLLLGWPMLRLAGPYLAVATFGFSIVVPEVVGKWSAFEIGDPDLFGGAFGLSAPTPALGSFAFDSSLRFWYVVLGVLLIGLFAAHRILRSRWGSALRAHRDSPVAAAAFGIDTRRVRIVAFGVAGVYAGVAGGLLAHLLGVLGPGTFSLTMSLTFLTAVVLGGITSPVGALAGAAAVVLLQEGLTGRTSNLQLWYGVVLLVAVVLTRDGIAGGATWLSDRIAAWGARWTKGRPGLREAGSGRALR
ncbi:MAG: branched-chain amino acid ABC transporter permease [Acidimicrobiales bacterium]|nr:branched-chain amino acid ABC transporter permease [Acidimicrobiales bacterium]